MHFRQHIPGFCEGLEPAEFDFTTKEELLRHPEIVRWTDDGNDSDSRFHRFSVSWSPYRVFGPQRNETGKIEACAHLMAEQNDGTKWWVVGTILGAEDEIKSLDLPEWLVKAPKP